MNISEIDIPKPKLRQNSDLLKRLEAFLPLMASANQNLENDIKDKKDIQIDLMMNEDEEEDSDDEDACSEDSSVQNDGEINADPSKRTIEMTVALGNFDENDPVMNILSNDQDDNDSDEDDARDGEEEEACNICIDENEKDENGTDAIFAMLQEKSKQQDESPLFTVHSTKRK